MRSSPSTVGLCAHNGVSTGNDGVGRAFAIVGDAQRAAQCERDGAASSWRCAAQQQRARIEAAVIGGRATENGKHGNVEGVQHHPYTLAVGGVVHGAEHGGLAGTADLDADGGGISGIASSRRGTAQ